jgi:hypothetical protein
MVQRENVVRLRNGRSRNNVDLDTPFRTESINKFIHVIIVAQNLELRFKTTTSRTTIS